MALRIGEGERPEAYSQELTGLIEHHLRYHPPLKFVLLGGVHALGVKNHSDIVAEAHLVVPSIRVIHTGWVERIMLVNDAGSILVAPDLSTITLYGISSTYKIMDTEGNPLLETSPPSGSYNNDALWDAHFRELKRLDAKLEQIRLQTCTKLAPIIVQNPIFLKKPAVFWSIAPEPTPEDTYSYS